MLEHTIWDRSAVVTFWKSIRPRDFRAVVRKEIACPASLKRLCQDGFGGEELHHSDFFGSDPLMMQGQGQGQEQEALAEPTSSKIPPDDMMIDPFLDLNMVGS